MDFANLGLSEHIVKAVNDAGYTTPTPVQLAAIPAALAGKDLDNEIRIDLCLI